MSAARTYSLLVHPDQWARCAHEGTALLPDGSVELSWYDPQATVDVLGSGRRAGECPPVPPALRPVGAGSLTFDAWCRAYRSHPRSGRVDVLPTGSAGTGPEPCGRARRGVLGYPTGVAVDRQQRLYVAETGAGVVRVIDLRTQRLLRRIAVAPGRPVDVAPDCGHALVLTRSGHGAALVVIDGRHGPRRGPSLVRPCYPPGSTARRVTSARVGGATETCPLVLWSAPDGRSVVARPDGTVVLEIDGASDLDLGPGGRLVVALGPGLPVRDFQIDGDRAVEREPLIAPGYDGGGVAIAPNGRVAFTTDRGYGWTAGTAARRVRLGRVLTYRLDSQAYRTRWGRTFVEACVPRGTGLEFRFVSSDEDLVLDPIVSTPPDRGARDLADPGATPTMVPQHLLEVARRVPAHRAHRRASGSERPWPMPGEDRGLHTLELPVSAEPGRYLWVEITLLGTELVSPRIVALRVERPGHRLLASLPRAWSRDEANADFLHRFLAPTDGLLHEVDQQAAERAALVNPHRVPREALAWLGSFAGLTLDQRWSEEARRTLVAEAYTLFRRRGTLGCLTRLLEIYLGFPPALIETWRLRGLAGIVLGTMPSGEPTETVGGAAAASSSLGRFSIGGTLADETTYDASAHRLTVLVPGCLGAEQRAVVDNLLETQRPAHTMVEVCELGDGMRLGQTVRPGLTAYVGPARAPREAVLGRTGIGIDSVAGVAAVGSRVAESGVGEVLVG